MLLKRFYTIFDRDRDAIGFVLANKSASTKIDTHANVTAHFPNLIAKDAKRAASGGSGQVVYHDYVDTLFNNDGFDG